MKAHLSLLLATFFWGLNFYLLQNMLEVTHFMVAAIWRFAFAVIALGLIAWQHWPGWAMIRRHLWGILLVGVLGLFAFNYFLFLGMKSSQPINASLIIALSPGFTLIISSLLHRQSPTQWQLAGTLLSLMGVGYLLAEGQWSRLLSLQLRTGDALILIASLLAACYHIWSKKHGIHFHNTVFTFLSHLAGLIAFLLLGAGHIGEEWPTLGSGFWWSAGIFGLAGTAVTYLLWNYGLRQVEAAQAGLYMNCVPLFTALIGISSGSTFQLYHLYAGLLVLSGLALQRRKNKVRNTPPPLKPLE